jgi:nucleotide-binding universal stress UspA family protein
MNADPALLAVNQLMGGAGGKGGVGAYVWEEPDLKKILESATATAKKSGFAASKTETVKSRDVGRAIVVIAEDHGVDHIVVGSHGRSGVSRLLISSVSRDVADRAHCPVTIRR